MRNIFTLIILFLFTSLSLTAQVNNSSQWTWMHGSNSGTQPAVYGSKGIAAAGNTPGSRSSYQTWTDAAGIFWLFSGGNNPDDLWKYNPVTNQWTWVKGSNTTAQQPAVFGTKGVANGDNTPGSRNGSVTWVDGSGKFWLFGGNGISTTGAGMLSDLWRYDPATNQWTWVNGPSAQGWDGIYGTKGVPAANNMPGARNGAVSWTDPSGNLWLFGGRSDFKTFNDLWKYNPVTGFWTWMNGYEATVVPQAGIYGTKGVPAPNNTPGSRAGSVSWNDWAGNFWLFGGAVLTNPMYNPDTFNDLWKYDRLTNQWTWISGSNTVGQAGVYGTKGTMAQGNVPGARSASTAWKDNQGNFWLFGGVFFPADRNAPYEVKNDLWKFDSSYNQWTWVSGSNISNQPGVYGTSGTPTAANTPGARFNAAGWKDAAGNLWLYGGQVTTNTGYYIGNDLWKFGGSVALSSTSVSVTSTTNPSVAAQSVTFTATVSASSGSPTGTVSFYDGTALLGTVSLSGNTAAYSTSALTAGNHSVTAVYNGSSTYSPATSAVLIQVVKLATTVALSSSLNPSAFPQAVSFTATVTATTGTPTGTVSFYDGTTLLGSGVLSGNKVTYTTASLGAGSHNITAVYSGNNDFAGSTSSILTQQVNTATAAVTLTSSANPSKFGETVSFTASAPLESSPGVPKGTMSFYDGTILLGTFPLTGNSATYSTNTLTAGTHNITAVYSGNSNYNGSTSTVLSQIITIEGGRVLQPYPNPIKSNIISFQMKVEKGEYTVTLLDKFGKVLFTKVIQHNGGTSIEKITAPHMTGGIYYLKIAGMGITQVSQVVKL